MNRVAQAWKAVVAFIVPGAAVLLAAAQGSEPITDRTWLVALLTAVVTSGGVYAIPNAYSDDPTTSTPGPEVAP